jgi:FkbM family methyltransferase
MTFVDDRGAKLAATQNLRLQRSPADTVTASPPPLATLDAALRWVGHQRWLRYGLRDRLLRLLRNPEAMAPRPFETGFAGFRYPGDLSRWIDWIAYYFGAYELDELELMRQLVGSCGDAVALDVGANVGHHALYMASFCAQVHAFEPFDGVAQLIDEKIMRNGLRNISVHRIGLSDDDDELPYFAPTGSNIGSGTFVPELAELADGQHVRTGQLALRQGDRYLATLGLSRLDFVKVDVEGFELNVLRGLRDTLRRFRPLVMLELSDTVQAQLGSMPALLGLLPPDYEVLRIVPPVPRLTFFSSGHASLAPFNSAWRGQAKAGDYVNLLLRPQVGQQHDRPA